MARPRFLRKTRWAQKATSIVNLQKEFGLVGLDLVRRIAKEIGLKRVPSLGTFVATIDSVFKRLDETRASALEPFAAFINETTERFSKSLEVPRSFIAGSIHSEKCDAFRKYLEDFVLKTESQPKGKHKIPGIGKIDLDDVQHRIG